VRAEKRAFCVMREAGGGRQASMSAVLVRCPQMPASSFIVNIQYIIVPGYGVDGVIRPSGSPSRGRFIRSRHARLPDVVARHAPQRRERDESDAHVSARAIRGAAMSSPRFPSPRTVHAMVEGRRRMPAAQRRRDMRWRGRRICRQEMEAAQAKPATVRGTQSVRRYHCRCVLRSRQRCER